MKTIQELIPFNNACDEFVNGKYILVDIKISSILNIVNQDEKIKDIVSYCLENFNFNSKYHEFVVENENRFSLSMPTDEKEIVAFVYNLLYRFKNNEIDFYDFLSKFYDKNAEIGSPEFNSFASIIIVPFKNAVNLIYAKRHVLIESSDYQNNYYNKIKTTIRLILENLDNFKLNLSQKEEFTMLLNSLFTASDKNDKKFVFSLMIGLDYFTKANKKARNAYLSLEECFE